MQQQFDNLIVLCGGLATRMNSHTLNGVIPKVLLSLGNETMLDKILFAYNDIVKQTVLVFSKVSHINIVHEYLELQHPNINVKLMLYEKTDGTFNTIKAVSQIYPGSALISWSDIAMRYANIDVSNVLSTEITVFVDMLCRHRYHCDGKSIQQTPKQNGNIIGLYAVKDLQRIMLTSSQQYEDIASLFIELSKTIDINTIACDFIDIGDTDKYTQYLSTANIVQRYFNDIVFDDDYVTKTPKNTKGKQVMLHESAMYNHVARNIAHSALFACALYASSSGIMLDNLQKYGYITVNEYLAKYKYALSTKRAMLNIFSKQCEILHTNAYHVYNTSNKFKYVMHEYYHVTIQRYDSISHLLSQKSYTATTHVNNMPISTHKALMVRLYAYLHATTFKFAVIHGDPNTANVMISPKYDMKFIDPRGQFGGSKIHGDINYDYAKFIYGLTGYTEFNLDTNFSITISNGVATIPITGLEHIDKLTINNDIKILIGLVWYKLSAYIINNPIKSIAAHLVGNALLNKYLPK